MNLSDTSPPVQSLSDDILYIVFEAAYLHDFPRCRLHSVLLKDSPVVVTHVCRRWRRLALELPALWSCIHITLDQGVGYADAIKAFTERSRSHPLSILLVCDSNVEDRGWSSPAAARPFQDEWPRYTSYLSHLLMHKDRWRECAFFLGRSHQLADLFVALHDLEFPCLRFLQVFVGSPDELTRRFRAHSLSFPAAPKLRELRINILHVADSLAQFALTDLALEGYTISGSQIVDLLASLSSTLKRLFLRNFCIMDPGPSNSAPRLLLPHLRSLTLASITCQDDTATRSISRLLRSCPDIEALHVLNIATFDNIMKRDPDLCFASVHSLFLHVGPDTDAFFWSRYLTVFPAVEDVSIRMYNAANCLAAISSETTEGRVMWPALSSFAITVHTPAHVTEVHRFLRHCTDVGRPVRSATLMCFTGDRPKLLWQWETQYPTITPPTEVKWSNVPPYDPFSPWDGDNDAPSFIPWKGLLDVPCQDL